MFSFSVAWMRLAIAITLIFIPSLVCAMPQMLFTSSVSYCAEPDSLLIQKFDVTYFAANSSISFNISAESVNPNINVTANMKVNVYGMHPLNLTIDLCTLLSGALCPLPTYNFTGWDSIPLPASLGIDGRIPAIAYQIPDLEAVVQLSLVEVDTGVEKACIQATLSNGWSTHQRAVEWTTGGIALIALASAVWQSASPEALAGFRLLDVMYLYQSIASTGFLNVNYPDVYRSFTLNFAWAMGLFTSSNVQAAIDDMRHRTGGNLADASGMPIALVNRKLSPYNLFDPSIPILSRRILHPDFNSLPSLAIFGRFAKVLADDNPGAVATVTPSSPNTLQAGVPIFVNSISIATADAFMTVFLTLLMFLAISAAALLLGYLVANMISYSRSDKTVLFTDMDGTFQHIARAWGLRFCLIIYTPVVVFTLYQWTLHDSWLSTVLAVVAFLCVTSPIAYIAATLIQLARRSQHNSPWTHLSFYATHSPLYAQYRPARYFFELLLLGAIFFKAIFIAAAQNSGTAQVVGILLLEIAVFTAHIILRPFKSKGSDVLGSFLAGCRVMAAGLTIAFLERLSVAPIPRVAIGIVIAVIFSIAVIVMFFNVVFHIFGSVWYRRWRSQSIRRSSEGDSVAEKDPDSSGDSYERPRNPTPEHNVPIDPRIIQTYPDVTPISTMSEPRSAGASSWTTDYGTVIPGYGLTAASSRDGSISTFSGSPTSDRYIQTPPTSPSRLGLHEQPWSPDLHS